MLRLHEYGFQSTRFHGIETASKMARFRCVFERFLYKQALQIVRSSSRHSTRASQFRVKICNLFQIDAVSPFQPITQEMKLYRFENAPLLKAF